MSEILIPCEEISKVEITSIGGDLYLTGWNREDIRIKEISDQDQVDEKNDLLKLSFQADAIINIPHSIKTSVEVVGGDAAIRGIQGEFNIDKVGGDLSLIDIESATIGSVAGDVIANRIQGDLRINKTGGDGFLDDIRGQIALHNVGGDVRLEKIAGGIEVKTDGDARLSFQPVPWQAYRVIAGQDISVTIPENSSVEFVINSDGKDITFIVGGYDLKLNQKELQQGIGEGGPNITLDAGGKVFISGEDFTWLNNLEINAKGLEDLAIDFSAETAERIKDHLSHLEDDLYKSLSGLSESLSSIGISEENLNQIASQIEESSRQAAHKAEIAAIKAQAKVEKYITTAKKKAIKAAAKTKEFDLEDFLSSREEKESVSPDERILVLNMLQEKKISPEEADDLLKVLEGKKKS